MSLTNLQRHWQHLAELRDLNVKIPFVAELVGGGRVTAEVLLEGYGAARGMLIVSDFAAIESKLDSITRSGFGYSCMSQPSETEVFSSEGVDDLLQDWGATSYEQQP
jgi:hypothetical protein